MLRKMRCVRIAAAHVFSEEHVDTGFEDKQLNKSTITALVIAI